MQKIVLPLYVLSTVAALVTVKLGTKAGLPVAFINNKIHFNFNFYTVSGILLYGFSFVTYIYLISKYDLGYILPLALSFVYILIFISSYFIFHEVFTALKIVGIALIVVGLVFLNVSK